MESAVNELQRKFDDGPSTRTIGQSQQSPPLQHMRLPTNAGADSSSDDRIIASHPHLPGTPMITVLLTCTEIDMYSAGRWHF